MDTALTCFQINLYSEEKPNIRLPDIELSKKIKKSQPKKQPVPKEFLDHIRALGFQEIDASILYEHKEDWMGISTGWLIQ